MLSILQRIRHHLLVGISKVSFPQTSRPDAEMLGSAYGGWVVPVDALDAESTCYLFGAGEDITFDLALIERVGCDVHCFDPTPRAKAHVEKTATGVERFHFHPWGVWSSNKTMKFYAPPNPQHVSHSIVNLRSTDTYFEAECKTVSQTMEELGHSNIDLMKLDIEGAEYEVINQLLESGIRPRILCIEFDQPYPYRETRRLVRRLLKDYTLYSVNHWNFHFIRR